MKFVNHRNLHYAEATLTPKEVKTICNAYDIIDKLLSKMDEVVDREYDLPTPYYTNGGWEAGHYDLREAIENLNPFMVEDTIHIDYGEIDTEDYTEEEEL